MHWINEEIIDQVWLYYQTLQCYKNVMRAKLCKIVFNVTTCYIKNTRADKASDKDGCRKALKEAFRIRVDNWKFPMHEGKKGQKRYEKFGTRGTLIRPGHSLFIFCLRGRPLKRKRFLPASYAPLRLKHSWATRELVCRLYTLVPPPLPPQQTILFSPRFSRRVT